MIDYEQKTLTELVELWYSVHGHTLKDAKYRYSRTLAMCERLNNPVFSDFSARHFAEYRIERLKFVSTSTVNHELRYLRAVFNELKRLDYIKSNPLVNVRSLSHIETELSYLDKYQIQSLFESLALSRNRSVYLVSEICLTVGCRWNEAETLKRSNLHLNPSGIRFTDTKNGKNRFVPCNQDLIKKLRSLGRSQLFTSCRSAFRSAVKRAGLDLNEQQMTHVLRHTFASYFLMDGGSIFTLQKVLGHSDIKTTMRYAHFSKEFLEETIVYSPSKYLSGQNLYRG